MKILDYVSCPICGADLNHVNNYLNCGKCDKNYEIVDNIPILVDIKNLPSHLKKQVAYFEKEDSTNKDYKLTEWQKSYLNKFLNNFENIENKIIIDCGTGSGYMAIELAKKGAKVIACDLTLKSLVRLKNIAKEQNVSEKIDIICCSAQELPFKNNVADYFISNAVLEHLPMEEKAIKEMARVCKSEAGLMITVPLSYKYLNPLLLPINYIHDKRIGHLRRYNLDIIKNKFSGWKIFSTYYTGHFMKVFKSLFNLIFKKFDEKKIEQQDQLKEKSRFSANNIICFLKR